MKPQFLITLCLLFITVIGYSQDKGYISLSAGPSFPTGDFGSKDVNNESAGLANTGAIFDLTFAQKFGKNLGMTLMLRGQANGVDTEPLVNELIAEAPDASWSAEADTWGIGGFLGGLYGSFPLGANGKVTFDIRSMIGYINAKSPEITVSAYSSSNSIWVQTQSADAGAFAYLLGAGLKFGIGKRLGILLNFDYMGATPEFVDVATYTSLGTYSYDT
jgi:hypothetical protein